MKRLIQSIVLFGFIFSCSDDELPKQQVELDHPTAMNIYCKRIPEEVFNRVEYEYDHDKLVTESTFSNGVIYSKTTFEYNSNNQLFKKIYETDWGKTEKTFAYNSSNQLINVNHKTINYDVSGQVATEREADAPLEYENNRLVKQWETWGGFHTYAYKNGKVVAMIDYTQYSEKYHITTYQYDGDLLTVERKETADGNLIYNKTFQYDAENRLIKIVEDENIIEENFYDENKLIEKRTYYYGIDPGFDVCSGNYIYKYEY